MAGECEEPEERLCVCVCVCVCMRGYACVECVLTAGMQYVRMSVACKCRGNRRQYTGQYAINCHVGCTALSTVLSCAVVRR